MLAVSDIGLELSSLFCRLVCSWKEAGPARGVLAMRRECPRGLPGHPCGQDQACPHLWAKPAFV